LICLVACENLGIDALQGMNGQNEDKSPQIGVYASTEQISEDKPEVEEVPEIVDDMIRDFTAYNAGDPYQTDDTPCIGSSGKNICNILATGTNVCASNEFAKGTVLEVEGLGQCVVLDRMSARYKNRIDWAMEADEYDEAIAFGLKKLKIKVIQ